MDGNSRVAVMNCPALLCGLLSSSVALTSTRLMQWWNKAQFFQIKLTFCFLTGFYGLFDIFGVQIIQP